MEDKLQAGQAHPLPPTILQLLLQFLAEPGVVAKEDRETLGRITSRAEALMTGREVELGGLPTAPVGGFTPEVENEANLHFQRVYAGSESLEDLMQHMARCVSSVSAGRPGDARALQNGTRLAWPSPSLHAVWWCRLVQNQPEVLQITQRGLSKQVPFISSRGLWRHRLQKDEGVTQTASDHASAESLVFAAIVFPPDESTKGCCLLLLRCNALSAQDPLNCGRCTFGSPMLRLGEVSSSRPG